MKVYVVTHAGYWERTRVQFAVKAKNSKDARKLADQVLAKAFKSFSFNIYSIRAAA